MYADDIVLLPQNAKNLQEQINIVKQFFEDNSLNVNLGKTKIVIFGKGRAPKKYTFYWGEEKLDIVNEYTYLGIKFHRNGQMNSAKASMFQKAHVALHNLFTVFYKAKINNIDTLNKLFLSLVNSILMYASPIWGVNFIDDFEKFQTSFLRRLLCVSNFVPSYVLRLETGIQSIKVNFFKALVNFLYKNIFIKEETSLNLVCYSQIKTLNGTDYNYNWHKQVEKLFKMYQMENEFLLLSKEYLKQERRNLIAKFAQNSINNDVKQMMSNPNLLQLAIFKTHVTKSKQYTLNIPWHVTKLIQNVRLGLPRIFVNAKTTNLNGIWEIWETNEEKTKYCELCNENKVESLFHIMFECYQYISLTLKYLQNFYRETPTKDNYLCILFKDENMNVESLNNMYHFWSEAILNREFYYEHFHMNPI